MRSIWAVFSLALLTYSTASGVFSTTSEDLEITQTSEFRITYYALCYSPTTVSGANSQFTGDEGFANVLRRTLPATKNWASPVTLVVPKDDVICSHVAKAYDHITTFTVGKNISQDESWVNTMQSLQELFMTETQSLMFVYFELDMIILPGAGRVVESIFRNHSFDVAYTYRGKSEYGSVNSGLILYRRTKNMFKWLRAVSQKTAQIIRDRREGGTKAGAQNQLAIDALGAENVAYGELYRDSSTSAEILSMPRTWLNGNADCCSYGQALVLHFNAETKVKILGNCCEVLLSKIV